MGLNISHLVAEQASALRIDPEYLAQLYVAAFYHWAMTPLVCIEYVGNSSARLDDLVYYLSDLRHIEAIKSKALASGIRACDVLVLDF